MVYKVVMCDCYSANGSQFEKDREKRTPL